jgi:hypothetical protein
LHLFFNVVNNVRKSLQIAYLPLNHTAVINAVLKTLSTILCNILGTQLVFLNGTLELLCICELCTHASSYLSTFAVLTRGTQLCNADFLFPGEGQMRGKLVGENGYPKSCS